MDGTAVANKIFDAIENNDFKSFDELCTPDAVMWQGFKPNEEHPFAETGKRLARLHSALKNLKYAKRRYELLQSGDVLVRHALTGTTSLGKPVEVHMMVRITLKNGKVARVEEVVDTAQLQPIYEAMQKLA